MEMLRAGILAVLMSGGLLAALAALMTPPARLADLPQTASRPTAVDSLDAAVTPAMPTAPAPAMAAPSLAQLHAACVDAVRRAGPLGPGQDGACARYEQALAARTDQPVPARVPSRPPVSSAPSVQPSRPAQPPRFREPRPTLVPSECFLHDYGSIAYRRCRAQEKASLMETCRRQRERAEQLGGDARISAKALATVNCRVAERYQIVR